VAVVGGSIARCAAAIALSRAGCDVTVHERSLGDLAMRPEDFPAWWSAVLTGQKLLYE
jgi:2-polyprenyl-6-methoxyphenol hydroxylase-like FAD-dependent oxidoreductase